MGIYQYVDVVRDSVWSLLQTIIAHPGVTIGILGLLAGALYYRLSNLESRRAREQYLIERFEDRQWIESQLKIEFDTLTVKESEGIFYKLRRLLFGHLDGSVLLFVYTNFALSDEMWDHDKFMKPYHEVTECAVEYRDSEHVNTQKKRLIFELDSIEHEHIAHAISVLLDFLKKADEVVDGVELERSDK